MKIKIAFAGGCHLGLGGIDSDASFPSVILDYLAARGSDCVSARLGPLPLSHANRLEALCAEMAPHILVLQMGHFELSQGLRRRLLRSSRPGASHQQPPPPLNTTLHRTAVWHSRMWLKGLLDALSGHSLIDFDAFQTKLEGFMSRVAQLGIPQVMVLSPIACADPVAMYYRRRALRFYSDVCSRHGFHYIDVLDAALGSEPFSDGGHLNAHGHMRLGEIVAERLASCCPELRALSPTSQRPEQSLA